MQPQTMSQKITAVLGSRIKMSSYQIAEQVAFNYYSGVLTLRIRKSVNTTLFNLRHRNAVVRTVEPGMTSYRYSITTENTQQ